MHSNIECQGRRSAQVVRTLFTFTGNEELQYVVLNESIPAVLVSVFPASVNGVLVTVNWKQIQLNKRYVPL